LGRGVLGVSVLATGFHIYNEYQKNLKPKTNLTQSNKKTEPLPTILESPNKNSDSISTNMEKKDLIEEMKDHQRIQTEKKEIESNSASQVIQNSIPLQNSSPTDEKKTDPPGLFTADGKIKRRFYPWNQK